MEHLASIIVSVVIAYYVSNNITRPILELSAATSVVEKSSISNLPGTDRQDEIGVLARSMSAAFSTIESEEILIRTVIDIAPVCISIRDANGVFLMVNKALADIYYKSPEEIIGAHMGDFYPNSNEVERFKGYIKKAFKYPNLHIDVEEPVTDAKGKKYVFRALYKAFSYLGNSAVLCIGVDITQLADSQLQAQAARIANMTKTNFLAAMSHEIRTPMNGVISMIDILNETDLSLDQQDLALTAKKSAEALLSIINDILDFSKIEAGHLELNSIEMSICDVVDGVTATLYPTANPRGVRVLSYVDPALPDLVDCDEHRLRQILLNLLGNAIKFSAREGSDDFAKTMISVTLVEPVHNGVALVEYAVRDYGIGISEADQKNLFQPFHQANARITMRKYGGTGLGLAISQRICEAMGGNIEIDSTPNEGSAFSFVLPHTVTQQKVASLPWPTSLFKGLRIIIACDDQELAMAVNSYVSHYGAETHVVSTQAELFSRMNLLA